MSVLIKKAGFRFVSSFGSLEGAVARYFGKLHNPGKGTGLPVLNGLHLLSWNEDKVHQVVLHIEAFVFSSDKDSSSRQWAKKVITAGKKSTFKSLKKACLWLHCLQQLTPFVLRGKWSLA